MIVSIGKATINLSLESANNSSSFRPYLDLETYVVNKTLRLTQFPSPRCFVSNHMCLCPQPQSVSGVEMRKRQQGRIEGPPQAPGHPRPNTCCLCWCGCCKCLWYTPSFIMFCCNDVLAWSYLLNNEFYIEQHTVFISILSPLAASGTLLFKSLEFSVSPRFAAFGGVGVDGNGGGSVGREKNIPWCIAILSSTVLNRFWACFFLPHMAGVRSRDTAGFIAQNVHCETHAHCLTVCASTRCVLL